MRILYNDGEGLCTSKITDALNYRSDDFIGVLFILESKLDDDIFIIADSSTTNEIISKVYAEGRIDISSYKIFRCDDDSVIYDPGEVY